MKMRLQIASVLSAPAKTQPGNAQEKGVFSATFQGMMRTAYTVQTQLGANFSVNRDGALPGEAPELETSIGAVKKPSGPIELVAGEVQQTWKGAENGLLSPVKPHLPVEDLPEQIEGAIVPQPGSGRTVIAKEPPLTEPVMQSPIIEGDTAEAAIAQNSTVKVLQMPPKQNDLARQPVAGATSHVSTSAKASSPQTTQKPAPHDETHTAPSQSSNIAIPVLQQSGFLVPVATLQPAESTPAPPKTSSSVLSSSVRVELPSGRGPVPSMPSSHAAEADKSFVALGSSALPRAGSAPGGEVGEPIGKATSMISDHSAGSQSASLNKEKASSSTVAPATQPLQSKAAAPTAENGHGASSLDARTPKDAEPKAGIDVKPDSKINIPVHSIPEPAAVEHQVVPNLSPAILHGTEKAMVTHRPQTSAAQMLQKMDMAVSPGVVQLRADARRLDVGVSSSTLGWVEVRATASPSGRIDTMLQTQTDASAHVLASQSSEISSYAREHSVQLGQVSVGVATGDSTQGDSRSNHQGARDENATPSRGTMRSPVSAEQVHHAADAVSLINVRV